MLADTAVIDRMTRRLEPQLVASLSETTPLTFEGGGRTLSVTGAFTGGVGFSADGYMLVSDQTFLSLFPRRSSGAPNHLLIRLAPGADPAQVADRLRGRLGGDLRVRSMADAIAEDQRYQGTERPTGIIFGFGVVIGVLVGIVIVYQVLSTDVADHLREYATFKAVDRPCAARARPSRPTLIHAASMATILKSAFTSVAILSVLATLVPILFQRFFVSVR